MRLFLWLLITSVLNIHLRFFKSLPKIQVNQFLQGAFGLEDQVLGLFDDESHAFISMTQICSAPETLPSEASLIVKRPSEMQDNTTWEIPIQVVFGQLSREIVYVHGMAPLDLRATIANAFPGLPLGLIVGLRYMITSTL